MKYKSNREDKIMEKTCKTDVQTKKKLGRQYASGLALAALLAFGYAMPAHGLNLDMNALSDAMRQKQEENSMYDTHVTLATITVPVRLHNFPSSAKFRVDCKVYSRNRHTLPAGGVSSSLYISDSVKHATVDIFPLKGASVTASQLASWQCFLSVNGKDSRSGLTQMHKSGTTYKPNVGGTF